MTIEALRHGITFERDSDYPPPPQVQQKGLLFIILDGAKAAEGEKSLAGLNPERVSFVEVRDDRCGDLISGFALRRALGYLENGGDL